MLLEGARPPFATLAILRGFVGSVCIPAYIDDVSQVRLALGVHDSDGWIVDARDLVLSQRSGAGRAEGQFAAQSTLPGPRWLVLRERTHNVLGRLRIARVGSFMFRLLTVNLTATRWLQRAVPHVVLNSTGSLRAVRTAA